MNRDLLRPLTRTVNRTGRLFNERNGHFYPAYIQNTFPAPECIAYIFAADLAPAPGDIITDRLDGAQYAVKEVRRMPCRYGSKKARHEATLVPLL
ncbi:hypothetical protein [Geomonas edaphica]|uniref:hypothetical protein n=1 Tax=Geomonas edaphica TaxID=2570226 RepID=UPI0010A905E9|nr:hypothetical protein [Geomonas edaphica]